MEGVPPDGSETDGSAAYQAALGDVLETLGRAPFDLDAVLHTILTHTARLSHATRGFIYLLGDDGLYRHAADIGAPAAVVAFNLAHPITPTRATLTGRVAIERRPVHIPDVDADPEYDYPDARRLGGFRTLLGVPLLREAAVVGVLSAWRVEVDPFTEAEIELVRLFADQAVIAVTTTRLVGTIERQRSELARFLSPQVADLISSAEGERLLAGHRREITVVFCDLRGFTAFSESAEPEEVLDVLRAYHGALGRRIQEAGGTLERFTGDGVMVFFNDPVEQADHAARAVRMARRSGRRWRDAGRRLAPPRPPARVRRRDRDRLRDAGADRLRGALRLRRHRQRRQPRRPAVRRGRRRGDPPEPPRAGTAGRGDPAARPWGDDDQGLRPADPGLRGRRPSLLAFAGLQPTCNAPLRDLRGGSKARRPTMSQPFERTDSPR